MVSDTVYEDLDWSNYEVIVFNITNVTFNNLALDHIAFGDRVINSTLKNSTIKSTALVGLEINNYPVWSPTINNIEVKNNLINHTVTAVMAIRDGEWKVVNFSETYPQPEPEG